MTSRDVDELTRVVAEAPVEELPTLLGLLVELEERARLRLRAVASSIAAPVKDEADMWLTPGQAAAIAGLSTITPDEARRSMRRIYEWARGQRWASRPSRKCLRISEQGFRRWLSTRG